MKHKHVKIRLRNVHGVGVHKATANDALLNVWYNVEANGK
jgi:hypothetical protein